ncbi:hypothetical protein GB881_08925, partial [Georgenia subflava]
MPFVPTVARPYLSAAEVSEPWSANDTLAPIRREALDVLGRAYASRARLGAGAAAWLLGIAAAMLGAAAYERWQMAAADAVVTWLAGGATFIAVSAAVLGLLVIRAGSLLSRAVAAWLATPTRAGRFRDAARPHRAIATRTVLGFLALAALLGVLAVLAGEILPSAAALGLTPLDVHELSRAEAKAGVTVDVARVLGSGVAALATGLATVSLLSGANRIHAAAWTPAPEVPPVGPGTPGARTARQTVAMLLVPGPAQPFLDPGDYRRDWTTFGSMMIRRQVALRTLYPAYADLGRLAVGTLAWVLGLAGATLVRAGAGRESALGLTGAPAVVTGAVLLLLGAATGALVIVAGARLSRGTALWAMLPHLLHGDGSRRPAGTPPPGRPVPSGDQAPAGSLVPRLLAGTVAGIVAVVWSVDVVRDGVEALAAYATPADRGSALGSLLGATVSWTAAVCTLLGRARVRAAVTGRVGPRLHRSVLAELHGQAAGFASGPATGPFASGDAARSGLAATSGHVAGSGPAAASGPAAGSGLAAAAPSGVGSPP